MRSTSICVALVLCAGARGVAVRAEVRADALPSGLAVYANRDAAAVPAFAQAAHDYYFQTEPAASAAGKPQSYWPVLYSTLLPGLGELTMGYEKRGIALMVVEVAAWAGYFTYHTDGLDMRDEYEAYADVHWSETKFVDDHLCPTLPPTGRTLEMLEECGQAVSGSGGDWWLGYVPWVSKEEDKQHYYENIGKYDWFASGWDDWIPNSTSPVTPHRTEYRAMREDSNDALDNANSCIWVSLAARVFSIAETAIIVRNRRQEGAHSSVRTETPVALRARPRGFDGGELALEVRFK